MVRRVALLALFAGIAWASPAAAMDFTGWVPAGTLQLTRSEPVATRLGDGRVLLTGGQAPVQIVAATELYDPMANAWTQAAPMADARLWPTAITLPDGRALVAGGVQGYNEIRPLFTGEVFDPRTGTWTVTGRLNAHHARGHAVVLKDGRVLLVSASGDPRDGLLGFDPELTAEVYDPATNGWALTGPMTVARVAPALALLPDGRVLAAGGSGPGVGASTEIYDPARNTWTAVTPMRRARASAGAATLPDGRVLVAGGESYLATVGWETYTSAEVFDPATGTWTFAGSMTEQRGADAAMATLADGRAVFVGGKTYDRPGVGGVIESRANTVAEVFDAASGTWSATAPTLYPHSDHVAVGLLDGSLLVAGGYDNRTERLLTRPISTPTPSPTPTATATPTPTPVPEPQPEPHAGQSRSQDTPPVVVPPTLRQQAFGRLTFSGLRRTLKPSRAGVITVKLRCSRSGACRDQLTVKRGRATLLRRDVTVAASSTATLRVKLPAPTRRALRTRAVSLALVLKTAREPRTVTVRR